MHPTQEPETGAYGGSRLAAEPVPPGEHSHDGRGEYAPTLERSPSAGDAEIIEAIADDDGWMADVLQRLVRAPTTLGNEEPGQQVIREALIDIGLIPVDVEMDADALRAHPAASPFDWDVSGKRNVVATWEPEGTHDGRSLILNGHIDVVSPEPVGQWGERSPFSGDREGDWVYGRGAADMKCGLAAILGAVRGLRRMGATPKGPVYLESVVEEECTGNGVLQTLIAGYTADAAVVAEPFGAAITTAQVGVLWFNVRIEGVPGHAAEGRNATNAIEESLAMISALREIEAELNAAPPPPFDLFDHPANLNVGAISGGDWASTVPGECVTEYRIALYPDMSLDDLRARIERTVAEASAGHPGRSEVRYSGFASPGYTIDEEHPLVTTLADAFGRQSGAAPALVATTGTTDAGILGNAGIPSVCFGPYAEQAHGVGERVYLPSVVQTAQVIGMFVKDWSGLST